MNHSGGRLKEEKSIKIILTHCTFIKRDANFPVSGGDRKTSKWASS